MEQTYSPKRDLIGYNLLPAQGLWGGRRLASLTSPRGTTFTRHRRLGERSSSLPLAPPSYHTYLATPRPSSFGLFLTLGDTHTHTPYQKLWLLLGLPAPVKMIGSLTLAGWRR